MLAASFGKLFPHIIYMFSKLVVDIFDRIGVQECSVSFISQTYQRKKIKRLPFNFRKQLDLLVFLGAMKSNIFLTPTSLPTLRLKLKLTMLYLCTVFPVSIIKYIIFLLFWGLLNLLSTNSWLVL